MRSLAVFKILFVLVLVAVPMMAQEDAGITSSRVIGEVKAIDSAVKQLTVKTDAGSILTVTLSDKTTYLRLAPGATTTTNATPITLADLAEGDRVMASGLTAEDRKSIPARTLLVMTK